MSLFLISLHHSQRILRMKRIILGSGDTLYIKNILETMRFVRREMLGGTFS